MARRRRRDSRGVGIAFSTSKNAISYTELPEVSEQFDNENAQCVRFLQTAWSNAASFPAEMVGYSVAAGNRIRRVLPEFHPQYTWMPAVNCELIAGIGQPREGVNGGITFTEIDGTTTGLARFRVTYGNVPYDFLEDAEAYATTNKELNRHIERRVTYGGESVSIGGSAFKLVDDSVAGNRVQIPEPPAKVLPIAEVIYVWYDVPILPLSTISGMIGKINAAEFDAADILGQVRPTWAAETLLFQGHSYTTGRNPFDGQRTHTLTYRFSWRGGAGATWNKIFRNTGPGGVGAPGFYAISSDGTSSGTKPYTTGDFTTLFVIT